MDLDRDGCEPYVLKESEDSESMGQEMPNNIAKLER